MNTAASMNTAAGVSVSLDDAQRLRAGTAVSWGAIWAGAIVAISTSVILLILGTGLGVAAISPRPNLGGSAIGFTVTGAIWLIVTQWLSAAIGGYIAGRLRQRWLATHTHEIFFRDTAHGLATWAVATLMAAVFLAHSASALVGGSMRALGNIGPAGEQTISAITGSRLPYQDPVGPGVADRSGSDYALDKLFRSGAAGPAPGAPENPSRSNDSRIEAMHIATSGSTGGDISDEDRTYLAKLVASWTGLTTDEATARVDAFIRSVKGAAVKAKGTADEARKTAETAALYTAFSLLIGAFIASVAAAIGGRLRDEHL